MSVHRLYKSMRSLNLHWKSTPKNECLWLKTLVLLKTLNWRNFCDLEDFDIHARNLEREDFCFRSFIFSFLSHRNHRTVKGGRGNTKETDFHVMLISKSYIYPVLLVKPLEISYQFSQFLQWQRRRSSGLWGSCYDWGVRNSSVRIGYTVRNMIALSNSNLKSDRCCATRQLSKISYHLTVISFKGIYVLSCRVAP